MMMHEHAFCWLNGNLLPLSEAAIPVNDHGLLYGDGVFEGIRFYHKRPFRLQRHLQRLERSARAIVLDIPYDAKQLSDAIEQLIAAGGRESGYIRLMVTRGAGLLGLNPTVCGRPNVIIIADQLSLVKNESRESGARVIVSSVRRLAVDGLDPRIKSLNYLNHILAKIEANHAGVDEAVLLNAQGRVAEGTADNLFIVRSGTLMTPPASEGALEGITRELILDLAQAEGIAVSITPLGVYDLYTADECFLTGTGAELIPVASVDCRRVSHCPGPIFEMLQQRFFSVIDNECGRGMAATAR